MEQLTAGKRDRGLSKLVLSVLSFVAITAAEIVAFLLVLFLNIPDDSLWAQILPECFGAAAALACVIALGGRSLLSSSPRDVAYTFRFGWWCMAISVALAVYEQYSYVTEGTAIDPGWQMRMVECAIFCLAIGFLEELMFRGLLFNGLLAKMGATHKGVVQAVMLTSLAFGAAHVDYTTDFVDGLSAVQALLKIVQTGEYSILLCVIMLQTREVVGVSLFHGLDDFMILAPSVALYHESADIDYVTTGEDAIPVIIYYLVIIALYLPFVIKSLRALRKSQVAWQGAFVDQELALAASAPLQPVVPAGPVAPVESAAPVEAVVPAIPAEPVTPVEPAGSVAPIAPAEPTQHVAPKVYRQVSGQKAQPSVPESALQAPGQKPKGAPPAPTGFTS